MTQTDAKQVDPSLDFVSGHSLDVVEKIGLSLVSIGTLAFIAAFGGLGSKYPKTFLFLSVGLMSIGGLVYIFRSQLKNPAGIRNNYLTSDKSQAQESLNWIVLGVTFLACLTAFFFGHKLGFLDKIGEFLRKITNPVSQAILHKPADDWFVYSSLTFFSAIVIGGLAFKRAKREGYASFINSATARGAVGWGLAVFITGFYVLLYWFGDKLHHLSRMVDPLSQLLRKQPADQWFLYSTLYTIAVLVMGIRAILKYRHSAYQVIRTCSVMFFQLILAYLIPAFLRYLNTTEWYFSYFWPLDYKALFPEKFDALYNSGNFGIFLFFWGAMMTFIATPILTYFYGKRWYCSWVCGCGGLANTAGDQWRQLSNKSLAAWKLERWTIHGVLVFIAITTIMLWANVAMKGELLGKYSNAFAKFYGFLIGSAFSGVIGVGFYPIMGTRVWCRFGCPMAAGLGFLQKYFSRFRITTNGAQCISCGNCSKYCEMGIDVRWYAQRGQNIIRSSCVGCGMCSAVCPRGVLNLENGPLDNKYNETMPMTNFIKAGLDYGDGKKVPQEV